MNTIYIRKWNETPKCTVCGNPMKEGGFWDTYHSH